MKSTLSITNGIFHHHVQIIELFNYIYWIESSVLERKSQEQMSFAWCRVKRERGLTVKMIAKTTLQCIKIKNHFGKCLENHLILR